MKMRIAAVALFAMTAAAYGQSAGTLNLSGPSGGGSIITPATVNAAVNAALAAKADASNPVITGGTISGADVSGANVTATGGTTARTAAKHFGDVANVLDFGADPTGVADSSVAINLALSATQNGALRNVYLPAGTYLVKHALNVGSAAQSQCLMGDGFGTILHVTSDFDPAAVGVVVIAGGNPTVVQTCVKDLQITFDQPTDIVTTASAASASSTSVSVASASGIAVGDIAFDKTQPTAIPSAIGANALPLVTVTAISGNTLTLSAATSSGGVASGDSLHFAPSRSMFQTLSAGCTTIAGGTGCKYPWAIYSNDTAKTEFLDHVLISGAWDGAYIRGSTFHIGLLYVGALDIGLDIDDCHNFPQIEDYQFWNFGIDQNGAVQDALQGVFYDGTTIAANLGATDGVSISTFQAWTGIVNLTSNWSWGAFNKLELDGNNANLSVNSTQNGFVQIANLYSTKGSQTHDQAIFFNPSNPSFLAQIGNLSVGSASPYNPPITIHQGTFSVANGYFMNQLQSATWPFIKLVGGTLQISNSQFDASSGRTNTYIQQTAGTLRLSNDQFIAAPGSGGVGVSVTDSALNSISGVYWKGWTETGVPTSSPLGVYGTSCSGAPSASYSVANGIVTHC